MQKWEYWTFFYCVLKHIPTTAKIFNSNDLKDELNALGEKGWEVCTIQVHGKGVYVCMKRKKRIIRKTK